ncbi:flagellar filament capping protein FliD [Alicyclobacillus sp. TC]|uniref:Flagellar hook-associated protein 2 n=1 Tax=Alicyclobacillus tolerans TaxID=90970 RepID=A0A1M6M3U0_9BACL|nr:MULTISPECIES: flagellar filament capping protein FliD [Alicyclobacillus]QRF22636.1 flagellar filament capping protein FliD [Alicyclobacillus sp. TC]SHJ78154.1 flagellar hook-associated protein 2 [Alicyclobacillus montanus]
MSFNALQALNTISNPGGVGLPVTQYAQAMQQALTQQLTTAPQTQLDTLQTQQSALSALQTALQTFQNATYTLASSQSWDSVSATSSDSSAFSATTSAGAQVGSYTVQVTQLASYQTTIQTSNAQSSATGTSTLSAGSLTINPVSGSSNSSASISITSGESLSSIASAINADTSSTGVQAQILDTTNGYVLSLSSSQTGASNGFTITDTVSGSSTGQFGFTNESTAQNANMTIDGQSFTSSTNTFSQAIPNVTITVSGTTSSSQTLSITSDPSSAEKAVQTWMSAYNTLIDLVNKDTAYTPGSSSGSAGTSGPLFTDPNATGLLSQLPQALNSVISTVSSSVNSLASVGIVINPTNGHLEFQSSSGYSFSGSQFTGTLQNGQTMFENAMSQNAQAVQQLFGVVQSSASTAIPTSGVLGQMNQTLNTFLDGNNGQSPLQGDINALAAQQTNIQNYLNQINQQIQQQVQNFTNQLNQLNLAMQQSQAQMQQLSALMGGSSSSGGSSGSPVL